MKLNCKAILLILVTVDWFMLWLIYTIEKLYGPAVSALRRAIAEVKQRRSVIGWVTKNLLSRAPPCFGRHVKPLVLVAFAVVNTHQPTLGPRGGLWPDLLMCSP
jgi:hypothetical protein